MVQLKIEIAVDVIEQSLYFVSFSADCNTGPKTNVSIACRPLVLPSIDRVTTYFSKYCNM